MKLYNAKVPQVARDILQRLTAESDLEVSDRAEAELDIQSVLREYLRLERDVTDRAKDEMERRGIGFDQFGRIKRRIAEETNIGLGAEGILWMCNQILETFMQSKHVEEVFSEDAILRRKMEEILRRHMQVDDDLDAEVRQRIKNLEEGTANWDVEYQKALAQIKQKRGLDKN